VNRRRFLVASAALAAAPGTGLAGAAARRLIRPPRLRHGDLVGLVAPGGIMSDAEIERAVRNLEGFGLRVKMGANIRLKRGNYAGQPFQQVDDLHAMFRDPDVRAVWGGRGGSGCATLLPLLDYRLIRAHPKVFVGFSDITALHLAIHRHAGLVTFHGPSAISTFSEYTMAQLRAVLVEPRPSLRIEGAVENASRAQGEPHYRQFTIREGTAEGPLLGGNLAVVSSLVGTPYGARMKGAIAFLEDINEPAYRIYRMLTQLVLGGELRSASGVMLGVFRKSDVPDGEAALSLEETLRDNLEPLGVPAAYGFSFGHIANHFTIPVGIRARLDTIAGTLTLLEPAVT
jgi:muramoyltetrapeptide carboxypeptidase